jgi:hypothetical protein
VSYSDFVGALVFVLVAALYRALMQFVPSEHPEPFPFIRDAWACELMTGAEMERAKIARAMAVRAGMINFIVVFLSGNAMPQS